MDRQKLLGRLDSVLGGPMSYDKALTIAALAHAGQRDKGGAPYLWHLIRVSENFHLEDEKVVALLHDIVEDTEVTIYDLLEHGLSAYQADAVERLTKRDGESYLESFIPRVRGNTLATRVKIHDLLDNLQPWRLKNRHNLQQKDLERFNKYIQALNMLGYEG